MYVISYHIHTQDNGIFPGSEIFANKIHKLSHWSSSSARLDFDSLWRSQRLCTLHPGESPISHVETSWLIHRKGVKTFNKYTIKKQFKKTLETLRKSWKSNIASIIRCKIWIITNIVIICMCICKKQQPFTKGRLWTPFNPKKIHAAFVAIPNHPTLLLYHRDPPGARKLPGNYFPLYWLFMVV